MSSVVFCVLGNAYAKIAMRKQELKTSVSHIKEALNVGNGKHSGETRTKCAYEEQQRKYWPTNGTNEFVNIADVWTSWGAQGNDMVDIIRGRPRFVSKCKVL